MDSASHEHPRKMRPKKLRSEAEKREIIGRHQESGMSVTAFCKQEGLYATQFYTWKKKLLPDPEALSKKFIRIKPPVNGPCLELHLPNGIQLKTSQDGFDVQLVKSLMGL